MKIDAAVRKEIRYVAHAMRERDFEEFSAVSPYDDRDHLAKSLAELYGGRDDILVAYTDLNEPFAIGGCIVTRPNVATLLFFATPVFTAYKVAMTRFIKKEMFPALRDNGVHRIEAASLAGYPEVHGWLETLGMVKESEMPGYGKNGETFFMYAWVHDDVRSARTRN
jgi:hypothetical protein